MFVYSYYTFTICIHWCYQHTTFFIPTHLLKKKNTDVYRDQTHLYPLQNNNVRNILYNIQFDSRFFFSWLSYIFVFSFFLASFYFWLSVFSPILNCIIGTEFVTPSLSRHPSESQR